MSDNPYQSPKTTEPMPAEAPDPFVRISRWLRWSFLLGLVLIFSTALIYTSTPALDQVLGLLSLLGSLMVVVPFLCLVPLTIWGFVKGYREGRGRR